MTPDMSVGSWADSAAGLASLAPAAQSSGLQAVATAPEPNSVMSDLDGLIVSTPDNSQEFPTQTTLGREDSLVPDEISAGADSPASVRSLSYLLDNTPSSPRSDVGMVTQLCNEVPKYFRMEHTLEPRNVYPSQAREDSYLEERAVAEKARVLRAIDILKKWTEKEEKRIRKEQSDKPKALRLCMQPLPPRFENDRIAALFVDRFGKGHTIKLYGKATLHDIFLMETTYPVLSKFDVRSLTRRETIEYLEGVHYVYCYNRENETRVILLTLTGFELVLHDKMKVEFNGRLYLMHAGDFTFKYGCSGNMTIRKQNPQRTDFREVKTFVYSVAVHCRSMKEGELLVQNCLNSFRNHLPKDKYDKRNPYPSTELCRLETLKDLDRIIECMNTQRQACYLKEPPLPPFDRPTILHGLLCELMLGFNQSQSSTII